MDNYEMQLETNLTPHQLFAPTEIKFKETKHSGLNTIEASCVDCTGLDATYRHCLLLI